MTWTVQQQEDDGDDGENRCDSALPYEMDLSTLGLGLCGWVDFLGIVILLHIIVIYWIEQKSVMYGIFTRNQKLWSLFITFYFFSAHVSE